MYKRTITYKDYNSVERTETFRFNLSEAELMEMEWSTAGGMAEAVQSIVDAKDSPALIKIFKDLLLKSYGEISPDGKRFMKSKELSEGFSQTPVYSMLFMELSNDADAAAEFVNGILPASLAEQAKAIQEKNTPVIAASQSPQA